MAPTGKDDGCASGRQPEHDCGGKEFKTNGSRDILRAWVGKVPSSIIWNEFSGVNGLMPMGLKTRKIRDSLTTTWIPSVSF